MKCVNMAFQLIVARRRAPHGARGLKCKERGAEKSATAVAPRMGRVD